MIFARILWIGATTSSSVAVKAVSLTDVTAQITPTSITSPVSTSVKLPQVSVKTVSEPDVAFPAVLKGSQKQRVPPPVPPRGSPKTKRGGSNSQTSSLETKGDYQLYISVNDIPPQTPFTSSDDNFGFYGHDLSYNPPACRTPPSISDHSIKISKLVASNSFLVYAEEGDSISERKRSNDLISQSNMMAKFNIKDAVKEHLETGNYDGDSFTDSSDEIMVHEIGDDNKIVINTLSQAKLRKARSGDTPDSDDSDLSPRYSPKKTIKNKKRTGFIARINTIKKAPNKKDPSDDNKGGLMTGLTKKFTFNQSIKDKTRGVFRTKTKPKIEIKTYAEEHSQQTAKEDIVCERKAKTKIDLFQKQILKVQSETDTCSVTSSRDSISRIERRDVVKETKKMFEQKTKTDVPVKRRPKKGRAPPLPVGVVPKTDISEKIRKFNVTRVPEPIQPSMTSRIKELPMKRESIVVSDKIIFQMRKEFEEII
ncbi:hypothetical protein KGM_203640 [Danaus plexippus plexippus]|uniref:Uncharacterized protein n=1 Tax=Danaus plexippus plexippus TaxID=278856 RepID=A0A212ENX7_DANPL|nr:hypothetical protein KGM_203640 [Danaus plexippus plexippus]